MDLVSLSVWGEDLTKTAKDKPDFLIDIACARVDAHAELKKTYAKVEAKFWKCLKSMGLPMSLVWCLWRWSASVCEPLLPIVPFTLAFILEYVCRLCVDGLLFCCERESAVVSKSTSIDIARLYIAMQFSFLMLETWKVTKRVYLRCRKPLGKKRYLRQGVVLKLRFFNHKPQ